MLTIETERRIAKFFYAISQNEIEVQNQKSILLQNEEFNVYQCFKHLDSQNREKIEILDIIQFLKNNYINCSHVEIKILFLFYNPELNNYWTYENFLNFLYAGYKNYENINKEINFSKKSENISKLIICLLLNVFKSELNLINNTIPLAYQIKHRYDYNFIDMFNSITNTNNISYNTLNNFLIRNGVYLNEFEIRAIISRLSLEKNEVISPISFKIIFERGYSNEILNNLYNKIQIFNIENFQKLNNFPNQELLYKIDPDEIKITNTLNLKTDNLKEDNYHKNNIINNGLEFYSNKFDNNLNNNCKVFYEEEQILKFLLFLLDTEESIEKLKCDLALRSDFNIKDCFYLFENSYKNYITKQDFLFGCQRLSLNFTDEEIDIFFKKYDLNGDGVLSYNNFFDMFVPFHKEHRKMVENRLPNNYIPKYNKEEIFLDGTKLYLQNLLRYIIESEKKINTLRNNLPKIKHIILNKISYKLTGNEKNYITPLDLANYLKNNQKIIALSEADILFIRFDRNRDGIISINDISREL